LESDTRTHVSHHAAFKTDTDISQKAGARRERELTAWPISSDTTSPTVNVSFGALGDEATFGPGASGPNGTWDQFAVNEKLFGVKTNFDEDLYTTKLDRNAADFKERERKAQQIANEIMGVSHVDTRYSSSCIELICGSLL
jgi:PAB1-binding protein PBP1